MVDCDRCDRWFQSWSAYHQHARDSSNHWICYDCNADFASWRGLEQHYIQSPDHDYCRKCGAHFPNELALKRHCIDEHDYCSTCDQFFKNPFGLREHNRQRHSADRCCVECNRMFNSENNLREHMNSSIHRPRNVPCAFQYRGCTQSFVSKSAMISHLENGACPSGADRRMINRWVQLNDRRNVVTVPRRLITDGGEHPWIATEESWNGYKYECVLCHNTFDTLDALNRHLASPRHQDKIYRCPHSSCLKTFNTLSGLCRHVESESCGVLKFKAVREGMDHLLRDMGRLRIQG